MISVLGMETVLAGFARAVAEIEVAEHEGMVEGAEVIRDAWVHNIEGEGLVLSGRYRDSVTVVSEGGETGVVTDVPYAGILEYGDSRQAAHPVAHRAIEENHEAATDKVGKRITEVIR